jgi:hypothetical protein
MAANKGNTKLRLGDMAVAMDVLPSVSEGQQVLSCYVVELVSGCGDDLASKSATVQVT